MIATTTTIADAGGSHGLPAVSLNAQYVAAVEEPGGCTILLTPAHDDASIRQIMHAVHGLLLTGGEDIEPARYGAEPHPALGETTPLRDSMEVLAAKLALERGIPILAVCRGMQLLNVAMGGTLIQDIPAEWEGAQEHEQGAPVGCTWHRVSTEAGSLLAHVAGGADLSVNSFHHQAVARLGDGLRATAWAKDGVVEGMEGPGPAWVCGVQWHPERTEPGPCSEDGAADRALLQAFVDQARRFAARESTTHSALAPAAQNPPLSR